MSKLLRIGGGLILLCTSAEAQDLPKDLHVATINKTSWSCYSTYNFLPEEYVKGRHMDVKETEYRLLGGASIYYNSKDKAWKTKSFEPANLKGQICAQWTITNINYGNEKCANKQVIVHPVDLGSNTVSLNNPADLKSTRNGVACGTLNYQGFLPRLDTSKDPLCDRGSSPITVPEILKNTDKYCKYLREKLPQGGKVGLSGGSSITISDKDCLLTYQDREEISQSLCANPQRQL